MRSLRPLVAACAALALILVPAAGASAAGTSGGGGAGQNVVRLPMDGSEIDSLNPFIAVFQASLDIINMEYEPLVREVPPNREVGAALASKWKVNGKTWTYTIRPDLKWSDGKPLTAKDIAWTYNQVMSNSKLAVANGSVVATIASVKANSDTTFTIVTKQPTAVNPGGLPIVPEHIWSKISSPDKYANTSKVVGSGPYVLTQYSRGASATMSANANYWGGRPSPNALVFVNYKNTDAAVLALRTGEVDIVSGMNAAQYSSLQGKKGIKTVEVPSEHYWDLSVNPGTTTLTGEHIGNGAKVLQDPVFRNAIRQALNTKDLVDKILGGHGSTGPEILPPGSKTYYSDYAGIAKGYSPSEANKALDDAGYAKGPDGYRRDKDGKEINLRLSFNASSSDNTQVASFIQPWLKDIGVKVTLNPTNWDEMSADAADGNYDMYINGWGVGEDPDYMLYINTCAVRPPAADGTGNATADNWCDPAFDALYQKQHAETNLAKRVQYVHEALAIHYKAAVADILYYDDALEAYRSDRLTNLTPMAGDIDNYWALAHAKVIGADSSTSAGVYWAWGIGIVVVLILAALVVVIVRRRRGATSESRE